MIPEAKTAQGKHVGLLVVEEGHQYPAQAWRKIQGAKDTRGCRVIFFGVPDGQTDSPFRLADSVYPDVCRAAVSDRPRVGSELHAGRQGESRRQARRGQLGSLQAGGQGRVGEPDLVRLGHAEPESAA